MDRKKRTLFGGQLAAVIPTLFLATFAYGQQAKPTPSPTPGGNEVVKISTSLIQIDVSVTDSKGNPITDLRRDEIEIFENGKPQDITNFSFISAGTTSTTGTKNSADRPKVETPIAVTPESIRRTIALVVDDLTLSFESAQSTRRALRKFVDDQMQEGDLVAVIRTAGGMGALQQLTTKKEMLYAAIEQVKWNARGRGGLSAFANKEPTMKELAKALGDAEVDEQDLDVEKNFLNSVNDFREGEYASESLAALQFIISGMAELSGRKSVILFSDGFSIFQRDEHGFTQSGRVEQYLRKLVDAANRTSVVFYAVDSRGQQFDGMTAADKIISPSVRSFTEAREERKKEFFDTQGGLQFLADETGGFAILNTNDLAGGIRKVLNDQSYYLVAYSPDSETFVADAARYNKFEVSVKREGAKVRYRSGFFNTPTEQIAKTPLRANPRQQLESALSSPFALNDIALTLNPLVGYDRAQGNYVRSLLHVKAKDLTFVDESNGSKKLSFAIQAASFGDNGVKVNELGKSFSISVSAADYQQMLQTGFVYYFTFPIKKPGSYQFRVAIRDSSAGKIGTASQFIKIPELKTAGPVLSSIVLEEFTSDEWTKVSTVATSGQVKTDPMSDTAIRRYRKGSVLRYGYEIYNANIGSGKQPNITTRLRVFREGKLILNGDPQPVDPTLFAKTSQAAAGGAIRLIETMEPGHYVLQVVIVDNNAKEKNRVATQFVQFEVIAN